MEDDESPREHWERRVDVPLTVAAVAFLAAYGWPVLDPGIRGQAAGRACAWVIALTWLAFALDYAVRLLLSRRRLGFIARHPLDLAAVALPLLRPLRLLRLVTVLGVLNRHARGSLRGRVTIYVIGSTSLVLIVSSLAMLDTERGRSGANIETFGDSLWWSITTVTTVGYGDHFPVTTTGRFVAAGLMVAGIALIGVVTATFASWLIERVAEVEEESRAATRRDVRDLTDEVARLRELVERLGDQHAG